MIAKHVDASRFLAHTRVVYLPGFTVTVKEELDALAQVGGKDALKLVTFKVSVPPVSSQNAMALWLVLMRYGLGRSDQSKDRWVLAISAVLALSRMKVAWSRWFRDSRMPYSKGLRLLQMLTVARKCECSPDHLHLMSHHDAGWIS